MQGVPVFGLPHKISFFKSSHWSQGHPKVVRRTLSSLPTRLTRLACTNHWAFSPIAYSGEQPLTETVSVAVNTLRGKIVLTGCAPLDPRQGLPRRKYLRLKYETPIKKCKCVQIRQRLELSHVLMFLVYKRKERLDSSTSVRAIPGGNPYRKKDKGELYFFFLLFLVISLSLFIAVCSKLALLRWNPKEPSPVKCVL